MQFNDFQYQTRLYCSDIKSHLRYKSMKVGQKKKINYKTLVLKLN